MKVSLSKGVESCAVIEAQYVLTTVYKMFFMTVIYIHIQYPQNLYIDHTLQLKS